ncbi:MAG TPA: type VI secretion system ATPase TssH, partial [Bradyrhizobium sp.]|nr:type VI secretion system ATPase TssH [Bradyrhizobium sp.]
MPDISLEAVTGKLNSVGYDAFMKALRHAKSAGHRHVELAHWLFHILQQENPAIGLAADRFKLDRSKLMSELAQVIEGFRKNQTEMPEMSEPVIDALDRGWYYATLFFGETQIRTGHILTAALKGRELKRALLNASKEFDKINIDALLMEHRGVFSTSIEEKLRPMDGSGMVGAGTPGAADAAAGGKGMTPLG